MRDDNCQLTLNRVSKVITIHLECYCLQQTEFKTRTNSFVYIANYDLINQQNMEHEGIVTYVSIVTAYMYVATLKLLDHNNNF